ncbi:MAG: hypothetical protein F082_960 [bacterium F082]|nr:MAG: hypothetical protein F082_960 [bacterium F082]KWW29160.1 MAG: hypothetical protein AUK64_1328 [bacterium P201]
MSDTVRLKIKVEDNFVNVEADANDLRDAMKQVVDEAGKVNSSLINSNQIAQAFEQMSSAVQSLQSVMHDLTDAYAVQSAAEARLEQVMRNTMDASEAEIQSIKDLAAAQQQLGIVGDEVQLSGAQELATYLSKQESLEALIPVMNDMIAQQYGYNASAESAVTIATMMGKVLDGQTGALSRYGYTFTEAQEQILKFGTEEERAATLAEVVEQSVGGMNEALAATPYGKIVQANNAFGDLKETLGMIVTPAMNVVDGIARITIAIAGVGKGAATIKSLVASIKSMKAATNAATVAQHGLNAAMKANIFIAVASAVAALVAVIVKLTKESREAGKATEELATATEAYKSVSSEAKAEIDTEIDALKRLMDAGKDTTEAVQHLNEKYGAAFGYYKTAADWYDTLTNKSMAYCRQLGYEAKAKSLSAQLGTLIVERDELKEKIASHEPDYELNDITAEYYDANGGSLMVDEKRLSKLNEKIASMEAEMRKAFDEAARASDELNSNAGEVVQTLTWEEMSYADLGKAINDQKKKVEGLIGVDDVAAKAEKATLDAMTARYNALARAYGLANNQARPATQNAQDVTARIPVEIVPNLKPIKPNLLQPIIQTLGMYDRQLQQLQQQRLNASREQLPAIDAEIARVKRLRDEFEGVTEEVQELAATPMPKFSDAWGGIKGIGNSIRDITNALTESEDAWTTITGLIDGFIGLFQSFEQVVEIINAVSAATETMAATKTAASSQVAAANSLEATTNTAVAATGAASAMANIPWVGPALAIAAVAAVLASLMSLPKFASGGLVYGPTLGLMGEYGGASSNPEVIAPLSRLQAILGAGGGGRTQVEFHIKGRELVGIMNKQNNIYQRSN